MLEPIAIVKKIQEMRESGYLADAILRQAVKSIEAADDRFDWVGIYLFNPEEQVLWLHNYLGDSAQHARVSIGDGALGSAAAEKRNRLIPDVTAIEGHVPCGPGAAAELVVPIRAGDEVLGEIVVDSHRKEAFTAQDEEGVQTVADKLAEVLVAERRS